jgi:thiamine-monophosphate kinase
LFPMREQKDAKKKLIEDLGEFALIDHLTQGFLKQNDSTYLGVGDDAALIDINPSEYLAFTTDHLVEGIHFDVTYVPLKHLGYKAVVVNLSDLYSMNAIPEQISVSLAISSKYTLEAIEAIYDGVYEACQRYGVDLIGGDTTSSQIGMMINVAAMGRVKKNQVTRRSGAKEHDLICVSGDLGAAYMGLQVLEREKAVFKDNPDIQPDLAGYEYILERQLKPEARKDLISWFSTENILPTSMIDISDGLASELLHLAKNSKVNCRVYEEKIPIDPQTVGAAETFQINQTTAALNGGEDYELLFTLDQKHFDKIRETEGIYIIGHVVDSTEGNYLITNSESAVPLKAQGWTAF